MTAEEMESMQRFSAENEVPESQQEDIIDLSENKTLYDRIGTATGAKRYNIIRDYILDELADQPITLSDGREAVVDRSDAKHIATHSWDKKTAEITQIRKIVETAELTAEEDSKKTGKFKKYYYYKALVKYNGDTLPVYVNVGIAKNDSSAHIYDLTQNLRDTARLIDGRRLSKSFALSNGISDNQDITDVTESQEDSEDHTLTKAQQTENVTPTQNPDIRFSLEEKPARRTRKPVAESRPIISKSDLRKEILKQFSIPDGSAFVFDEEQKMKQTYTQSWRDPKRDGSINLQTLLLSKA